MREARRTPEGIPWRWVMPTATRPKGARGAAAHPDQMLW
jgi:hypothetical protein